MNPKNIKLIIGLGNPGRKFVHTRHNIGFRILDALADDVGASFKESGNMEIAEDRIGDVKRFLVKPQTYMNNSGDVLPALLKKGIEADQILVVHDELEMAVGKLQFKFDGSHRGHNGLKSIMSRIGKGFYRLRFGIARPEHKEDVPDYVLAPFEDQAFINERVQDAVRMILDEIE